MSSEIAKILAKFNDVKVLVVGDVMLDRYWWGSVTRISPEAPVPVVNLENESLVAGGAANVAANIKGLGATPYLVGIIGNDAEGIVLQEAIEKKGISADYLCQIENRPTTVKTRVVAHHQQIVRVDTELKAEILPENEFNIWKGLVKLIEQVEIVVISDYNKGFLTDSLLERLITTANIHRKKVLVDPKGKNYQKYQNATLLTPNRKEAFEATKIENIVKAGNYLVSALNLEALLITQGEDGMSVFEKDKSCVQLNSLARHVYDVTGAGDTVIATLAVSLAAGADLVESAKIANIAAGYVVEEIGTTTINFEKMRLHFKP